MPSLTAPFRRAGRLLVGHVRRLQSSLEQLGAQVRAAIARIIGQATGDAVRDALAIILDGPPGRSPNYEAREERSGSWNEPRRPSWPSSSYDPYRHNSDEDDEEPAYGYSRSAEEMVAPTPASDTGHVGVWSRAVAAGCQTAGWWLRKYPGPMSWVAAVGVGLAAGATTLFGGPFVAAGSAVTAAALGVLAVADAARSAATLANTAIT
jgi:hypothetical protein